MTVSGRPHSRWGLEQGRDAGEVGLGTRTAHASDPPCNRQPVVQKVPLWFRTGIAGSVCQAEESRDPEWHWDTAWVS